MATIEELLQKINRLEERIDEQIEKDDLMIQESRKAAEFAKHAYRVDHVGFIWVWNVEVEDYRKTNMRIMSPELADLSVKSRHIADGAVLSSKIGEEQILSRHIAPGVVRSSKIGERQILSEHILPGEIKAYHLADKSITGDTLDSDIPNGKLADDAVHSRNIFNGSVLPCKLDPNLLNEIRSAGAHGYALTGLFGDSTLIGIHQKALTEAFNAIWQKMEEITGESLLGISMNVSPEYFIGENGCTAHITANTASTAGTFEHIAFYVDGELVREEENTDYLAFDVTLYQTSVIKCVAKILGVEYVMQKVVTHYNSFWLGAGRNYQSVMDLDHIIPITEGMRGSHDVEFNAGDRIFIIIGESLRHGFTRADMNGVEIQFTESTVTFGDNIYKVLTSVNTYDNGIYNIDING